MYKKILVPLDGSHLAEQILRHVYTLAAISEAGVELLWVNDPEVFERPPHSGKEYLERAAAKYLKASFPIEYREIDGRPAEVIVRHALAEPSCLIAMATHGMSGIQRWLLGSVASKVLQTAVNPILLIRPTRGPDSATPIELKTVIVPLDGSGLAEKALRHVVPLAKQMKMEVQLIRVYTLPANAYVVADGVIVQGPAQSREKFHKEAETYLDGKLQELRAEGLEQVLPMVLEGDPAGEIIDLANTTPNSLIAMSTHGRSGIGRWVLGSVAEKVVQHSRDPVLLIRAA